MRYAEADLNSIDPEMPELAFDDGSTPEAGTIPVAEEEAMAADEDEVLTLKFDCKPCEMHVVGRMKGHILDLPQPGSAAGVVGHITPDDLLKTIRPKA